MKETISYYYNIEVDSLEEKDGKYYFKYQNRDFFFVFYNRTLDELKDLIDCINGMRQKGIDVHQIFLNINNSYLTKVGEYDYILFSVNNASDTYDIFEMLELENKLILNNASSKLYRNNWAHLWSEKVDYFEYQIRELAINKDVVKNSFSYYIGLCENAITYVNNTNKKYNNIKGKVVLSHRRIFYPNYKLNYLNPLSFIFDLNVRDIAEYLKAMFFKEERCEVLADLESYLKVAKLNPYELSMFYARLLYPSYYFDIYEEVMNKERSEEDLIRIIKKNKEYEEFLKKAYLEISKYAQIDKIDWLTDQR